MDICDSLIGDLNKYKPLSSLYFDTHRDTPTVHYVPFTSENKTVYFDFGKGDDVVYITLYTDGVQYKTEKYDMINCSNLATQLNMSVHVSYSKKEINVKFNSLDHDSVCRIDITMKNRPYSVIREVLYDTKFICDTK